MAGFNPIIYGRFWVITEELRLLVSCFVRVQPAAQERCMS